MPKKRSIDDGEMLAWLQANFSELKKLNLANEKRLEQHLKRLDKTDERILKLLQALQRDRQKQDERWQNCAGNEGDPLGLARRRKHEAALC